MLANLFINGTINGSIYALIALGFSLTFGVAGIVNLYHGTYYMLAAYFVYIFLNAGFNIFLSTMFSLIIISFIAFLIMKYPILYLQKRENSGIYILIFTLGLAYFTQYLIKIIMGAQYYSIPAFYDKSIKLFNEIIPGSRYFAFIIAIIIIAIVMLLIKLTSFGKQILATSQDKYAAQIIGINTNKIFIITMILSAVLSGISGIIISTFLSISPTMWLSVLLKAFSIVILGGLGSIWGSIIASYLMAYLESLVAIVWTSSLTEVVFLILVFIFLIFKPTGIMGKKV